MELESVNLKQTQKNESMKILPFVFLFTVLVLLDQAAKYLAKPTFLNYQFAFSIPLPVWLMYFIYAAVLGSMIAYCKKHYRNFRNFQTIAWTFILSGALSNIGERIALGYVRDWIYILTGVFNLADGYILLGILILLIKKDIRQMNNTASV